MKKNILIGLLALLGFTVKAQIPNSGFESLNTNNNTSFWGEVHLIQVWIDSTGSHGDSIVYDDPGGRLYFPSTDAYQGNYALEMRNAFNYTSGSPMVGMARLSADSNDYSAFAGNIVSITQQPATFGFYYKFTQAGADTAVALVSVYDVNAIEIGTCVIEISDAASAYTYISQHINYTSPDSAAYISIEFRTSKSGNPTFGTRFLVDEVGMQTVGLKEWSAAKPLVCYPVPVTDRLHITSLSAPGVTHVSVLDALGNIVISEGPGYTYSAGIDVTSLPAGIYIVQVMEMNQVRTVKFVK